MNDNVHSLSVIIIHKDVVGEFLCFGVFNENSFIKIANKSDAINIGIYSLKPKFIRTLSS